MRFFFFIFVFGISYSVISQTCCDDKCIKKLKQQVDKGKGLNSLERVELSFQLANCYKGKDDSLAKKQFFATSEYAKMGGCYKDHTKTYRLLYFSGLCYFELKEYKTAEIYLSKTIASKYQDSVIYYYHGLCNLYENDFKEALMSFEKQKELYPKVNEVMVGNYVQTCKASITK